MGRGDAHGIWKKKIIMGHKRGCFWGSPYIGRREGARGGDKGREGVEGARGGERWREGARGGERGREEVEGGERGRRGPLRYCDVRCQTEPESQMSSGAISGKDVVQSVPRLRRSSSVDVTSPPVAER